MKEELKIKSKDLNDWVTDLKMIRLILDEVKLGTVCTGFARQRLEASCLNLENVIDQMKDELRGAF